MYRFKNIQSVQNRISACVRAIKTTANTASNSERIVLPKRISRSPTDILYALSCTVGRDPTAPHYKYHDDPFLIPYSEQEKETFALAQEAGKKAARSIKQEWPQLFEHVTAEPTIEAFLPTAVYNDDSQVDVNTLKDTIEKVDVSGAITVYHLLIKNNVEIADDLKQSLLELVAYYNETDVVPFDAFEERNHISTHSRSKNNNQPQNTWSSGGFADKLFESIEPKTSAAHNAMIRGLLKFDKSEQGYALYETALEKKIPLDTATFNSVILCQTKLHEKADERWKAIESILQTMNELRVRPNVETMNSIIEVLRNGGYFELVRTFALRTLAEFKTLNIEPTLGTWYLILKIFCKEKTPISHILVDILNHIGDKEFQAQSSYDIQFFPVAMAVCSVHLKDEKLAKRLDQLLNTGENYKLLGDSLHTKAYYRSFLQVLLAKTPFTEFLETYDQLVPNVFSLDFYFANEILNTINFTGAIEHTPRIYSDIVICGLGNNLATMKCLLELMIENKPQPDFEQHAGLNEKFAEIGWDIWQRMKELAERDNNPIQLYAESLGNIVIICCWNKQFERGQEIIKRLLENRKKDSILGVLSLPALKEFIELSVENKQPTIAIDLLEYAITNDIEGVVELAKPIVQNLTLDDRHWHRVNKLIGADVIKSIASK